MPHALRLGVVLLWAACAAHAAPLAFTRATLLPIHGPPITNGVLVIDQGRIQAVGDNTTAIPPEAVVHELPGRVLMPGLICTHSHIGGGAGGDASTPIQPEVRILDAIDVRHSSFRRARSGGLTTVNIMPGSGHLVSGQTAYLKLRRGESIEDLLLRDDSGRPLGGLKMANGTNSRRDPPFPGTRGKSAALVREQFIKAQAYRDKITRAAGKPDKLPDRDLALETLVEVLEGRLVVHHHTHRHDDILTVLRLQREFGFRVVLHHVSDAWAVAPEIAAAGVPCSVILLDSPGGKIEARDITWENAAILEKAGVLVALHTDDPIIDSRLFLRSAAFAVRAGMSREGALRALTLNGARILGLDHRLGTLEPGKDADFIVLSGDPLSVYSHVVETWIEGRKVFDRSRPEDRLAAEGGFGAGESLRTPLCCFEQWSENHL